MSWKYGHSEEYIALIRQHPLTPIVSRPQHDAAVGMLKKIAIADSMSQAESDYFDVLSKLILEYENSVTKRVKVAPSEALKFLMEQNDLSQADISRLAEMQPSHLSEFLTGKERKLPKRAALVLAAHFKVDPAIFLTPIENAIRSKSPRIERIKRSRVS